jgi:hypothetical protein
MAIGAQADIDDTRPHGRYLPGAEAPGRQAIGAIALHHHVRIAQQRGQRIAPLGTVQVDVSRQLAPAGVGDRLDVGQRRRVHQHHVGAIGGQRAPANRPGENAGEIEHTQPLQRPGVGGQRRQGQRRRITDALDAHQGQRRDGARLRMQVPLFEAARGRDHQSGPRRGVLEFLRPPARQRRRHRLTLGRWARLAAQQAQGAVPVVREVGMDAHPVRRLGIAAAVETGDLVPGRRHPAIDRKQPRALDGRVTP